MRPILFRAFLCSCALAILPSPRPASAQPFHSAYFAGDPDNEITSVVRAEDGGFVAVGHFENLGRVVKLRGNGAVDWVRGYGPIRPLAVRAARGGGIAWIGHVPDVGNPPFPVFVLSDFAGALKRVHRIVVPGTQRVEIRALDVDPGDGSFWIGGSRRARLRARRSPDADRGESPDRLEDGCRWKVGREVRGGHPVEPLQLADRSVRPHAHAGRGLARVLHPSAEHRVADDPPLRPGHGQGGRGGPEAVE